MLEQRTQSRAEQVSAVSQGNFESRVTIIRTFKKGLNIATNREILRVYLQ
jgi:hypothetical protein